MEDGRCVQMCREDLGDNREKEGAESKLRTWGL